MSSFSNHCEIFKRIDANKEIQKLHIHQWLMWPALKEVIWNFTFNTPASAEPSVQTTIRFHQAFSILTALYNLVKLCLFKKKISVIAGFTAQSISIAPTENFHPHYGNWLAENSEKAGHIKYQGSRSKTPFTVSSNFYIEGNHIAYLASLCARFIKPSSKTKIDIDRLSLILSNEIDDLTLEGATSFISKATAIFHAKYILYRFIFKKLGAQSFIVTDPDGKTAEIAAAKSLGLKVVELQHGMLSSNDPDYSWTSEYKHNKDKMTVADEIIFFGEKWKEKIAANKFWDPEELHIAKYPLLQIVNKTDNETTDGLQILISSQPGFEDRLSQFTQDLLSAIEEQSLKASVVLKLHPKQTTIPQEYNRIDDKHGNLILSPANSDIYKVLQTADIVIGFTSFSLIEALACGKTTFILSSKNDISFYEHFQLDSLKHELSIISSADEFIECLLYSDKPIKKQSIHSYFSTTALSVEKCISRVL